MGFIVMLAVLAAVVWVIVALLRSTSRRDTGKTHGSRNDPALDALRKRYARGEIDRDTFERMRRDLDD